MDIERDQLLAQKFCKPAFSSKLKKCHLPDSLLSMNVTCNIEEVSLSRSKDIGSSVRIPMYLSRRFNPADYMSSIVVGYGCVHCPVTADDSELQGGNEKK